jgi:hypothetical protein
MIARFAAFLLALATWPALAQPTLVQPTIDFPPGYALLKGTLLVTADGGSELIAMSGSPDTEKKLTPLLERISLDRAGAVVARHRIDVPLDKAGPYSVQATAMAAGELLLFVSDYWREGDKPGRTLATLYRIARDGSVRHRTSLGHPHYVAVQDRGDSNNLQPSAGLAMPDGTVLLGGSYGIGPSAPWWGRFSADGVRLAEFGHDSEWSPATAVFAISVDPGGGWRNIISRAGKNGFDLVLQTYSPANVRTARLVLLDAGAEGTASTFTEREIAAIAQNRALANAPYEIVFFSRDGKRQRSAPWPEDKKYPAALVADGDGLIVLLQSYDDHDGSQMQLARIDREGRFTWRSPSGDYGSPVPGPDGELRALQTTPDAQGQPRLSLYRAPARS